MPPPPFSPFAATMMGKSVVGWGCIFARDGESQWPRHRLLLFPNIVCPASMSTLFRYDPTPASNVRGSSNDTSGAYHDSIMGSKNVAYSRERTRFRFETAFDNGGVFVVDDDDDEDVAAVAVVVVGGVKEEEEEEAEDVDARAVGGGAPLRRSGRGQRQRRSMQHRQYFLMLGRAPAYFWVDFFVRESKRFMVEQNLILFYPWCYYATQKYYVMRRGMPYIRKIWY